MKTFFGILMLGLMLAVTTGSAGDDLDRTKRPVPQPAPKVQLPQIQKAKLSNGLEVRLVEHHELPTVSLNLVIQAGSDHDPVSQPGIASMTADVIDEGTTTRSSLQIAEELELIGASMGVNSSYDGSFMTLGVLKKHLPKALGIFADVLTNPTFPQKEFDRLKRQRLTSLTQQKDQPTTIANNAYSYILYGGDHPYGNNPSGTEASLNAMTREELVTFYQTYFHPNNATLIVVGDVTMPEILAPLEQALAAWKPADVPPFAIQDPKPVEKTRVFLVDKPGAPQSEVRIGYPALSRNTPDFFPVVVMNRLLGGQFSSRINLNLRERHGYTYGANSGFRFNKGAGPFTAQGGIVTEKTDSAMREFMNEIELMRDKGMDEKELTFVKNGLIGNFALTFETPGQIAGALQNVVLYGLPEDYYNKYLQNIEAVSLTDVNAAARKYLNSSKMAMVVVGDLSKIQSGIEQMKFGDVVLCDTDGKPLPFIKNPNK
jgi:predicted Zn-dependent peptidase